MQLGGGDVPIEFVDELEEMGAIMALSIDGGRSRATSSDGSISDIAGGPGAQRGVTGCYGVHRFCCYRVCIICIGIFPPVASRGGWFGCRES